MSARFHHQGKTAAFPCPGHLHLMHPVCATPSARHLGHQFATVLEKVQVPPAPFDGVVYPAEGSTLRTLKMLSPHVFQSQFQALWFSLKATFHYPPLLPQAQRRSKKFFRCHGSLPKLPIGSCAILTGKSRRDFSCGKVTVTLC